jgi:AAA domain
MNPRVKAQVAEELRPRAPESNSGPTEPRAGLRFTPWAEVRASAPPEPPWVVEGFLARGGVTLLAGKPKCGKSTLAVALGEAVDAGAPTFLGRAVAGGPVVYLSEEGAATLAPKLPESARSVALTRDGAWPKPSWAELIAAAVEEAKRIGAVLLVIDALAFWAAFREGEEKDAGAAMATMDALGVATGAGLAVLVPHHQRKAGGEDGDAVRGSGAIFGAVDMLVELERLGDDAPPGYRRLVAVGRWDAPPVLVIDRDARSGVWRVAGQAASRQDAAALGVRELILRALPGEAPGATEAELVELVDLDARKVSGPLRELLGDGNVAKAGKGVKGNPFRYWKCSPESSPTTRGESDSQFSPSPIGGEKENRISEFPHGEDGGERGESASAPLATREEERAAEALGFFEDEQEGAT